MTMENKPNSLEQKEKIDLRILVADDDPSMVRTLKLLLGLRYTSIETVENGQLLIDKILSSGNEIDFLVTDNTMPKKMGIEAIREIRAMKDPHLKDLPIIMCSSDTEDDLIKELKSLNVFFIEKPFQAKELYAAIESLKKPKENPETKSS